MYFFHKIFQFLPLTLLLNSSNNNSRAAIKPIATKGMHRYNQSIWPSGETRLTILQTPGHMYSSLSIANRCVHCESQLKLVRSWEVSESWNKSPRSCSQQPCDVPLLFSRTLSRDYCSALSIMPLQCGSSYPCPFRTQQEDMTHTVCTEGFALPSVTSTFLRGIAAELLAFHLEICTC